MVSMSGSVPIAHIARGRGRRVGRGARSNVPGWQRMTPALIRTVRASSEPRRLPLRVPQFCDRDVDALTLTFEMSDLLGDLLVVQR